MLRSDMSPSGRELYVIIIFVIIIIINILKLFFIIIIFINYWFLKTGTHSFTLFISIFNLIELYLICICTAHIYEKR